MCGRYSLAMTDGGELQARFPIGERVATAPRYNVAPGTAVATVTTDREGRPRGEMLRWGLVPGWAKDANVGFKMINARAETLWERAAYRSALERYRCLIPADGFFEWQRRASGPKQPFHIARTDGALFAFAGLWSVWRRGSEDELRTCTIITTAANAKVGQLHERMPVILTPDQEQAWLDPGAPEPVVRDLLSGLPAELTAVRAVSTAVNDVRNDGPECLADPTVPEPPAQGALFG